MPASSSFGVAILKSALFAVTLLTASHGALAQQLPSAGGQIQQIPPRVEPPRAIPEMRVERAETPAATPLDGPSVAVSALRVTGATVFSEAELITASGFKPGSTLSLAELRQLAVRIADFYNRQGFFVAQAYLPAQTIADGSVTIAVVEGRYDKIGLNNQSSLSEAVAGNIVEGLEAGDIVSNAPLERRLLLLSDVPGVTVKSTLSPGAAVGTSDLLIDVMPGKRVSGNIEADNAGNRYTGYYRLGGTINLNNPFGIGDVASVRGLVSDRGLTYIRGSYQALLGKATVGVAYARLDYRLKREFASLRASGSADIASLYASYPLVRSYDSNLYLLGGADFKSFHDEIDVVDAISNKRSQVGSIGLSGDSRDDVGGGGANFYSAAITFGNLDIRTPDVRAADALTARTDGSFGKLNLAVGRLQTVSGPLSLYLAARGQLASQNLDISEKMELGGADAVRAYPEGEAYGDQGYLITAEARLALGGLSDSIPGGLNLFAFIDNGGVTFNRDRFFPGRNSANLSGAGAGLSWSDASGWLLKGSYAHRLGDAEVMSQPDKSGRFWAQLVKFF